MEQENEKRTIVAIYFNEVKNQYEIEIPQGSNVAEAAFAIAALTKCLVRDKVIEKTDEFINTIKKYVEDPQYQEVVDVQNED